MTHSDPKREENPEKRPWISSGFDATGLLVAAFFAIVAEGFFTGPSWPLAVEISMGIAAGIVVVVVLRREFWKSHGVSASVIVYRGASWVAGLLAGLELKLALAMSWPTEILSLMILLLVLTWVVRQQRFARKRLDKQNSKTMIVAGSKSERDSVPSVSEGWFRRKDLIEYSKPWLAVEAVFGGSAGFAASALILLPIILRFTVLIPLFVPGVTAATFFLAAVGLLRNHTLRYIAARGFKTAFHFQADAFGFYLAAVASGTLGLGYYYGYGLPLSTELVLPFAGLFVLFIYLYSLWGKILVDSEKGRLCIFQFLVEYGKNGQGYSWLKRGLHVAESKLQNFGVAVNRHSLYFGSSYSILEGSYPEWDLDNIYLLGDWSAQTNGADDLKKVHNISAWFLYRSKIAKQHGFSKVDSLIDRIFGMSTEGQQVIVAIVGVIASMIIALLLRG